MQYFTSHSDSLSNAARVVLEGISSRTITVDDLDVTYELKTPAWNKFVNKMKSNGITVTGKEGPGGNTTCTLRGAKSLVRAYVIKHYDNDIDEAEELHPEIKE